MLDKYIYFNWYMHETEPHDFYALLCPQNPGIV